MGCPEYYVKTYEEDCYKTIPVNLKNRNKKKRIALPREIFTSRDLINRYKNPEYEYIINNESIVNERDFNMKVAGSKFNGELMDYFQKERVGLEEYINILNDSDNEIIATREGNIPISSVLNMLIQANSKDEVLKNNKKITLSTINAVLEYAARVFSSEKSKPVNSSINKKEILEDTIISLPSIDKINIEQISLSQINNFALSMLSNSKLKRKEFAKQEAKKLSFYDEGDQ